MLEVLGPQCPPPAVGELLSKSFHRESATLIVREWVDELQVAKLMQEDIVEHITTHGERGPLHASLCSEHSW